MKKMLFTLAGILIIVILFLVAMRLLNYRFNKNFVSFNQQECIDREYPTYNSHSGIEGCIFWMRNDYLEKTQSWKDSFVRDDRYCDEKYHNTQQSGKTWAELNNGAKSIFAELNDPKCNYEAVKDQKRKENWSYLISKEKDGFYNYCVDQICPKQPLFK